MFVSSTEQTLPQSVREHIARQIHVIYRNRLKITQSEDPSLADWDNLVDHLKNSNRAQADHIEKKLSAAGYKVRKARGKSIEPQQFSDDEIEIMAELEHGRWSVERLLDGWKWGPIKDVENKSSPFIMPWTSLPEEIKEYDRDTARQIPHLLKQVGIEVVRKPSNKQKRVLHTQIPLQACVCLGVIPAKSDSKCRHHDRLMARLEGNMARKNDQFKYTGGEIPASFELIEKVRH